MDWSVEATTAAALAMGDGGAVGKGKDPHNGTRMDPAIDFLRESKGYM